MKDPCAVFAESLDRLLSGDEDAVAAVEDHLRDCPACRDVADRQLRLHRLLLEVGAAQSPASPGQRRRPATASHRRATTARHRRRSGRRSRQRHTMIAVLAVLGLGAALVAIYYLPQDSVAPSQQPDISPALVAGDDRSLPSWLQVHSRAGSEISHHDAPGGGHRVVLHHGRLAMQADARRGQAPLFLQIGSHTAQLLGTSVDAFWNTDGIGMITVRSGQVTINDLRLQAGQEVVVWGDHILPPLPSPTGAAWTGAGEPPPDAQLLPARAFAVEEAYSGLRPSEDDMPGPHLVGLQHRPGGRQAAAMASPDAAVIIDLPEGTRWQVQVLCRSGPDQQLGFSLDTTPAPETSSAERLIVAAPERQQSWLWLPSATGDSAMLTGEAAPTRLSVAGYHSGFRIAAILLRPAP